MLKLMTIKISFSFLKNEKQLSSVKSEISLISGAISLHQIIQK